jgi:hypothetical protein
MNHRQVFGVHGGLEITRTVGYQSGILNARCIAVNLCASAELAKHPHYAHNRMVMSVVAWSRRLRMSPQLQVVR